MADYWKSQAKKFCDFCKCWIADNKPSVEFHEKGKRHKENVEKRLKEIGQKSRKEYKETLKVDSEMKKMEEAAMKAYLKDIEGDGDYTSQLIKRELKEKDERMREEKMKAVKEETEEKKVEAGDEESAGSSKKELVWYEAISDEGHTYYWHMETGEAIWEAPEAGFVSIAEQAAKEEKQKRREEKIEVSKREEEEKERDAEERARKAREKMKSRRAKKETKETVPFDGVPMGPAPRPDPYGGWKTVETTEQPLVDLQLPTQSYAEIYVPAIVDAAPRFRIREKTIGSLESEGSGDFKKRKFNGSSRKNARQRLDEED